MSLETDLRSWFTGRMISREAGRLTKTFLSSKPMQDWLKAMRSELIDYYDILGVEMDHVQTATTTSPSVHLLRRMGYSKLDSMQKRIYAQILELDRVVCHPCDVVE